MWIPSLPPWEVALRATVVYAFVQLLLRLIGRKELARYATHDVAMLILISTAARQAIVGGDTSLTSAMIGLTTVLGLDGLLSYLSFRSVRLADVVQGKPRLLVQHGHCREDQLRRARLSRAELETRLRTQGIRSVTQVDEAYLERSGRISVILRQPPRDQA